MKATAPAIAEPIQHLTVPVDGLVAYPGNARRGNLDGVKESIQAHGQFRPIVVNKRGNVVLAGNHTLRAMTELGASEIAATFVDVDEEEAARINLVDNRLNDVAVYDTAALIEQLQTLPDLSGTGYTPTDLDELLASITTLPPALADLDDAPEAPPDPITRPGDVILLGKHRLVCGDSTVLSDVEKLMDGRQADMVWTDPLYGVAYVGKTKNALTIENDSLDEADLEQFLRVSLSNAWTVSKEGACWYAAAPAAPLHLAFAIVLHELDVWRQTLIWLKDVFVLGYSDYHYRHEPIFYGWKQGAAHRKPMIAEKEDRTQDSIWEIARPKRSIEHPTMKPVELIERAITNSSKPGWIVLDLFGGSGSTLIAAEQTNRTAYLMELDPKYCDVIVARWEAFTGRTAERLA